MSNSLAVTSGSPSTCLRLPSWFITRCSAAWSIFSDLFLAASVWRTSAKVSIPVLIVLQMENRRTKNTYYFIYVAPARPPLPDSVQLQPPGGNDARFVYSLALLASSTQLEGG